MINELLLLSGKDIPFIEAQINIHPPKIYEIGLVGEKEFLIGLQLLTITKDKLSNEDKIGLENKSNFDIFMSIMCSPDKLEHKNNVMMTLALIFPEYQINFTRDHKNIVLLNDKISTRINNTNFEIFQNILVNVFDLTDTVSNDFNPVDKRAARIAEKIKKYREKIAKQKGENQKVAIYSRYASILSIGMKMDINIFMNYTVFQLKDAFNRFKREYDFDIYVKSKLAGAQDLDEVDNWMDDIHTSLI